MNARVTCENCKCKGKLFKRNQSREVILIPTVTVNIGIEAKDPNKNEKGFLAPHGFATALQMINFLVWGTLFWVTVMLIANYVSFEKTDSRLASDHSVFENTKSARSNLTGIFAQARCTIAAISKMIIIQNLFSPLLS